MDPVAEVGKPAPHFALPDLAGEMHRLSDYRGRTVLVNFWSADCPWSERTDGELAEWRARWGESVLLLPVASNADESVDDLGAAARARGLPLVLRDEGQRVADLYGAQATPHFFLVDAQGILRYAGAPHDGGFRRAATRNYLADAVAAVLAGREPDPAQTPARGCAIVRFG
jgi:peroxiredoxin